MGEIKFGDVFQQLDKVYVVEAVVNNKWVNAYRFQNEKVDVVSLNTEDVYKMQYITNLVHCMNKWRNE